MSWSPEYQFPRGCGILVLGVSEHRSSCDEKTALSEPCPRESNLSIR